MLYPATVYRVLIASPSDVASERAAIRRVVFEWNSNHSIEQEAVVLPVMWEFEATPEMGEPPQAILNRQLVNSSDILIGMFWTRLGTPTTREESGTVEEINEFLEQRKPVLLYFSTAAVTPSRVEHEQFRKLTEFKHRCRQQGIVFDYESINDLGGLIHRHLLATVRRLRVRPT
jgi:hypothetical protein